MAANRIPDRVRQLIAESIDSVVELEAILLLRRHLDRSWSAEEAGRRLYVSDVVASHVLSQLKERGFLCEVDRTYRYEPRTTGLDETVAALAAAYSNHLVTVTNLIHGKPSQSVREFAKAFRLRKDP